MRRSLGCRKALYPAHETRLPFRLHAAMAVASTPDSVDLRAAGFTPPTKDQGGTGSCNGHRASTCIQTTAAAQGRPLSWTPSEVDIYRCAREIERARQTPDGEPLPPLQDIGSMTADVVAAISTFGIRARVEPRTPDGRDSDADPATVNDDQTLGELEAAALELVAGEYSINPRSPDAVRQIRAALAGGIAVGVDFYADTAFEDWGEAWTPNSQPCGAPDESDPNGGGHAIACVAYKTMPDGSTIFGLLNSWGDEIGDAGMWWVTEAWLRAAWEVSVWNMRKIMKEAA